MENLFLFTLDMIDMIYLSGIVIGGSILAWTYTKSGKRWLASYKE